MCQPTAAVSTDVQKHPYCVDSVDLIKLSKPYVETGAHGVLLLSNFAGHSGLWQKD